MALTDKQRKLALDGLTTLAILALVAVVGAGVLPQYVPISTALQTGILAAVTAVLAGCSFLFNTIDWKDLRGNEGPRILHRGRADLILTMVSILALFTVVVMVVFELFALVLYLGVLSSVGTAGAQVASNFVLVQTIILLVYLLALLARQANPSRHEPKTSSRILALVLTPLAIVTMAFGTLLAFGVGTAALGIKVHQAVYVVTLGVLLEFIAMRIRLALPGLWSLFAKAMKEARRAEEEAQVQIRKKALRVYVAGSVFVALSMAFVGAMAAGTITVNDPAVLGSLAVFYVGGALVFLGMVAVRMLQHRTVHRRPGVEGDELSWLVGQKRRKPEEIFRIAVYAFTGLLAFVFLVLCVLTYLDEMSWHRKYATDLFILAFMFGAGPFGVFYNRERKRIAAIDDKFPDFLRDLAESARAGMTLPKALVTASQGSYGALNPEIKTMAAQVQWGVEFGEALRRFAQRCNTPLIDRTVALVVEAQRAGGSMIDVLTAASDDAREIKQIVSERSAQMSMYNVVIYIAYFVFIVVVLVLALQFIPAFKAAVDATGGQGAQVGGINIHQFDPEDFYAIFFQAAVVQAIGGGLVGGVLTKGSPVAGFPHISVMLICAWLAFRLLVGFATGTPENVGG
ncbi:MAG: type II secretion system F family protein [Thermoplasmatota archaeon]